jgi:tRNA (cytidine/uridine-2'-O-)-methyltransferase
MSEASSNSPIIRIALWEPEIPPNTGNVARLCAGTGAELHMIGKLGFRLDDASLRRAGLGYWSQLNVQFHANLEVFEQRLAGVRLFAFSARVSQSYTRIQYERGDCLVFGSESRGLPREFIERMGVRAVTVPMPAGIVRSLNLSTTVGIAAYEALRQITGW